jgi:hypothetical protein
VTTTAAAAGTRRHTGTYPAEPRQVGIARAALAGWLDGGPQDEAILVASEFATNSVLHSASWHGGAFTLRAEVRQEYLRIIDGTPAGASPGPGSAGETRVTVLPPPADAARVSCFLADQPRWSIYWDKKYGLWRVAEDDPEAGPDRSR